MKQLVMGLVMVAGLIALPQTSRAHDAYDDSQSNPLRLIAYAVNPIGFGIEWLVMRPIPIGFGIEWLVMRPIHFLVSQPSTERVFGHTPHESPFGDYSAYRPEDDID